MQYSHLSRKSRLAFIVASSLTAAILATTAFAEIPVPAEVPIPFPEPGSFFTTHDYTQNGRLLIFDGFTVSIQEDLFSLNLVPIGTLPEAFRGGTDPVFALVSPDGSRVILGAGAGGSQFPDPDFNGNIFEMPISGGEATLIGQFPFHIRATFRRPGPPDHLVFSQGETFGFFVGSVELLDLGSNVQSTLVGDVPGDPGGVVFDNQGNLYVGLALGADPSRAGEIHRYERTDVENAIQTGVPLDFETDGTLIAQVSSASDLHFNPTGDLFVGGGDVFGTTGSFGFVAVVDVDTGEVIDRFDPTDGDPDDGDFTFFIMAFTNVGCRLGIVDSFSFFGGTPTVYQVNVCP